MPRILFVFFCLILFWSPLPLGSHRVWSSALLELLIAILFMAWLLTLKKEQPLPHALSNNKTIIALFFAIPLWSALQLIPLPPEVLTWLSPHHLNYLESPTAWQSLSLDTGATLYKLQKSIAYALFFVLALALINTPNRLNQVAQLLVICGVLQAAYGVLVVLGGKSFDVLGIREISTQHLGSATGTFVNRNH